jgi:hypothetical protein
VTIKGDEIQVTGVDLGATKRRRAAPDLGHDNKWAGPFISVRTGEREGDRTWESGKRERDVPLSRFHDLPDLRPDP